MDGLEHRVERYVYHKDWTDGSWNVFGIVNGEEDFAGNYKLLKDAQDFCANNNGVLEAVNASSN